MKIKIIIGLIRWAGTPLQALTSHQLAQENINWAKSKNIQVLGGYFNLTVMS